MIINSGEYKFKTADKAAHHDWLIPSIYFLLSQIKRPSTQVKILDAGCGNGYLAGCLAKDGFLVSAIDLTPENIVLARIAYPEVSFYEGSVYDDLTEIMPAGGWDVIVSSDVIEHLFSPQSFLKRMYSQIRPGGGLILTTPYHGYLKNLALSIFNAWDKHLTVDWEGGHIKFFSEKSLSHMLHEQGFENVIFHNSGRVPYLWKSLNCLAIKM